VGTVQVAGRGWGLACWFVGCPTRVSLKKILRTLDVVGGMALAGRQVGKADDPGTGLQGRLGTPSVTWRVKCYDGSTKYAILANLP
jgi:hypothetical protein